MKLKKKFNLICGHYGCGKTNLALNLAIETARSGKAVTLVDLDLVNPYFRSSDYLSLLKQEDIQVIAPVYANTNVDIPSLPAEINSIFDSERTVILDVGGDDVGATVLGRFHAKISAVDYDMFYVVNRYRNLTVTPEEAAEILQEIEATSRCRATAVINNSHLKSDTTVKTVLDSLEFAERAANILQLPLATVTVPEPLYKDYMEQAKRMNRLEDVTPVSIYVRTNWEE